MDLYSALLWSHL